MEAVRQMLVLFSILPPGLCGLEKSLYKHVHVMTKQILHGTVFLILERRVQQNNM